MNDETALSKLRKMIISQKTATLIEPESSELAPLYSLLHQYDEFVARAVFLTLQGQHPQLDFPAQADLEKALAASKNLSSPQAERSLRQFERYNEKLDEMLSLAGQVINDHTQGS